ncbi:MAG TPA: zinc ribbon domain-containing protein [Frankiaceae bacterium]|jgi:hypothetical protein|nr:zinc ribbon domain-containing protein [Frankiaceae bacterium]
MTTTHVDPSRCPECGTSLRGRVCPGCDLVLVGPAAAELWQVLGDLQRLGRRRVHLVERLRAEAAARAAAPEAPPAAPAAPAPRAPEPARQEPVWLPTEAVYSPTPPPPPARAPRPRREWTPQRVQNVLLVTGVLVTLAAAIIFVTVRWGDLPLWARGALMAAATAVTGYGARYVHRRGLDSSAEALGALTVALGTLDAYAVHAAGLTDVSVPAYWTFASAVVAAGAAAFARVVPVRSVRYLALAAAHMPVLLTVSRLDAWTMPQRMLLVGAQGAGLLVASRRLGGTADAARYSGAVHWLGAVVVSATAALGLGTLVVPADATVASASLTLLLLAAVPLLWPGPRAVTSGLVAVTLAAAAFLPAQHGLTGVQLPAAVAAIGLLGVVAALSLPRDWRDGPLAVGAGAVAVALLTTVPAVAVALLAPLGWAQDAWSVGGDPSARAVVMPGMAWNGTVVTLGVVVAAAAATAVVGALADRRVLRAAYVLAAVSILLVPLGFAWSFRAALAWNVALGAAALAAAVATKRLDAGVTGCIVLAVAGVWSLANDATTVAVSAALAVVFAAVAAFAVREAAAAVSATAAVAYTLAFALSRGAPVDRGGFLVATAAVSLLGASMLLRIRSVGVVAVVAYGLGCALAANGAGWLAWSLGIGAAVAAAYAARDQRAVPPAAVLAVSCAGVTSHAFGAPQEVTGLVLAVAGALLAVAAVLPRLRSADGVAVLAYASGLAVTAVDPRHAAWALGAGAAAAVVRAAFDERVVPVAAALGLACVGVTSHALGAPQARTGLAVAVAAAVLAAAASWPRLRLADPVTVTAYVAGLALAFERPAMLAWALAAGTAAAVARAAGDERLVPLPAALGLACAGVTSHALGAPLERTGLVVAALASALAAASVAPRLRTGAPVAGIAYVAGAALTVPDPGWLAWTLGVGALGAAAYAVADRTAASLASALGIACVGVASLALGAPVERAAFVVTLAAAASVAASVPLRDARLEWVAATAYAAALAMATDDTGWLSWVLAAGGVTALADATRPERRELAWVGGTLLTACSWTRLFLEGVRAPEAYAAPLAITALALGHLRRRRDESVGSWAAYGTGLSLAFGPSMWLVLTEPTTLRALLVAVAATAVLLAGVSERLQAPLTVGAGVLVVDAFVQVAPFAAALPKWATLGALGIAVIAVGVTYEDRRRDVDRLRQTYESLR